WKTLTRPGREPSPCAAAAGSAPASRTRVDAASPRIASSSGARSRAALGVRVVNTYEQGAAPSLRSKATGSLGTAAERRRGAAWSVAGVRSSSKARRLERPIVHLRAVRRRFYAWEAGFSEAGP